MNQDVWKEELQVVLESKVDEFHHLGYERASSEDVWQCLQNKWKNNPPIHIHQAVSDLLRLSPNEYMNWLTMQVYQAPSLFNDEGTFRLEDFEPSPTSEGESS
ncbi:post-transcriptional regulator [Texcoconibacillus texcoconensis]|uniref:Post-transcriptional regulator n=1 Tax=Texcoconibacillus texcoconensis TaxID=1095777 RepID=A0A840QPA1_9BACI|nr:post-transcriptional regulator [Texcoconibacillus texcoconensis]MBB5173204.1 hypothetical protein [Texcoconibacillus texcoconensis]